MSDVPNPRTTEPQAAPVPESGLPDSLGGYRLVRELGRGAMGVVYAAEDPRLNRRVALKVMVPEFASKPTWKVRFLREARAQAAVEHDHIIAIHHVGEANGVPFIAMPLLKGQTLAQALGQNPRPPIAELVRIGREVAEGLAAAHAKGLIHRDIKPSNIWLEAPRRRVKILDFGLARNTVAPPGTPDSQPAGGVLGTLAYMPPEQVMGRPADGRADLFSLGVVLYQMATGTLPFTNPSYLGVMAAIVSHEPLAADALTPGLPPALSDLIRRLMAKNPAERPHSAEAVAEELTALERGLVPTPVTVIAMDAHPGELWAAGLWPETDVARAEETQISTAPLSAGAGLSWFGRLWHRLGRLFALPRGRTKPSRSAAEDLHRPVLPALPVSTGAPTDRTDDELARELNEFGRQLPKPQYGDANADARWFEQCLGTPAFEPYRGSFVAVLNEAVVGHGPNALQLQLDVARERNVHPHRLIVEYIPRAEF